MVEAMEEREDIDFLERFSAEDDGFRIPSAILQRELVGGEHRTASPAGHINILLSAINCVFVGWGERLHREPQRCNVDVLAVRQKFIQSLCEERSDEEAICLYFSRLQTQFVTVQSISERK